MSLKSKILNILTAQPKLLTLGIGLAITFGTGIVSGIVEAQQAHAALGAVGPSITQMFQQAEADPTQCFPLCTALSHTTLP